MSTPLPTIPVTSPLLTVDQAGAYLRLNPRTLANWRVLGKGPRYIRSGARALYRLIDLDGWIDEHRFAHMAEERARKQGQVGCSVAGGGAR